MLHEGKTLRLLLGVISSLSLGISVPATRAEAPLAPEYQPLKVLKSSDQNMHPKLAKWFQSVEDLQGRNASLSLNAKAQVGSFASRQLLLLDASNTTEKIESIIKQVYDKLLSEPATLVEDPLYPILLYKLGTHEKTSIANRQILKNKLLHYDGKVCSKHKILIDDIKSLNPARIVSSEIEEFVSQIEKVPVKKFQSKVVKELLSFFEKNQKFDSSLFVDRMFKQFPDLIDNFPQLSDKAQVIDPNFSRNERKEIDLIEASLKKNHCNKAKRVLTSFIEADRSGQNFETAKTLSENIENCYRRSGGKARLKFWYTIKDSFKNAYGYFGDEFTERKKGLIYWNLDDFKVAKDIFRRLVDSQDADKFSTLKSRNLYTLARIYENEGDFASAITEYAKFIKLFPNDPEANNTYTSLVLLNHISGDINTALHFAKELIDSETLKPYDERDSSNLPFALFWYGSLNFSKGQYEKAFDYWRRLANEYFSTFYGALGHYMLEQWFNKPLEFHPGSMSSFDPETYKEIFSKQDQFIFRRIDALLQIGFIEDASCELAQVEDNDMHFYDELVKAMYHYKLGEWLQTVRLYAGIPRSFRQTLPRGMERILFPKSFTGKIATFSKKVGVEEELIYSITRQESVFNPIAQSPVGASGLMQLMPATGRLEAQKISSAYLQGGRLRKASGNKLNLFDPETNIILGVHHVHSLFKKFKNPVYVLTSYNANPTATKKWMENIQNDHMLNFIERIPYLETRGYVKLVMRNYFYYKRWYKEASEPMPLMEFLVPKTVEMARRANAKAAKFMLQ